MEVKKENQALRRYNDLSIPDNMMIEVADMEENARGFEGDEDKF